MPARTSCPGEQPSFRIQVDAAQGNASENVGSYNGAWHLRMGFGFACLALLGVSAWFVIPHVSLSDSAQHSSHDAAFAFSPGRSGIITNPESGDTLYHLQKRSISLFATSSRGGGAVLERQRAPPAPPPAPPSSGGGGGGSGGPDDDPGEFRLRAFRAGDMEILDNWIARTRVYCMSAQFGDKSVAEVHRKSLADLEGLRASVPESLFKSAEPGAEQGFEYQQSGSKQEVLPVAQSTFLVALELTDKNIVDSRIREDGRPKKSTQDYLESMAVKPELLAIAGGAKKFTDKNKLALVIQYVSVSPFEFDKKGSNAAMAIKEGLRNVAQDNGLDLIMPPT